jgi:hypothetical protein
MIGIVLVGATLLATMRGCNPDFSDGQRSGELRKISRKGIVNKSWEGQLLLSNGYVRNKDGSGGPDVWAFSVTDPDVAEKLNAMPDGAKVTLTYRQWFMRPWSTQDSSYTVVGVK